MNEENNFIKAAKIPLTLFLSNLSFFLTSTYVYDMTKNGRAGHPSNSLVYFAFYFIVIIIHLIILITITFYNYSKLKQINEKTESFNKNNDTI